MKLFDLKYVFSADVLLVSLRSEESGRNHFT